MTDAHQNVSRPGAARIAGLAAVPLLVFASLIAVFYFGLYRGDPSRLPSALIGKSVPEFALEPLADLTMADGAPVPGVSSADLASGRVSVVNIWASWCGPCRQEHPFLMQLAQVDGIDVVGINYKDVASNARRFLGLLGSPYDRVGVDPTGRTAIDWGVYGVPETFIVDGEGIIVYKHVGPMSAEILEATIEPMIEVARGRVTVKE